MASPVRQILLLWLSHRRDRGPLWFATRQTALIRWASPWPG